MGCSKRGVAVSIATGVDPDRVAGALGTPNSMMTEMPGSFLAVDNLPTPWSSPSTSLPGACGWRIRS